MNKILIVDDERANREALQIALTDENPDWDVLTVGSESEGSEIIRQQLEKKEPIEVVLTDLVMSCEQSGMNMLIEARKIDPFIMSILFTAKEKNLDRYAAFDLGAFDVVEKNILGKSAAKELCIKTRAAIRYREWALRIGYLRRYFDPKMFDLIEREPGILAVKQRLVTIVFWDIRGFSKLCEILKAHPNLVAGFLQQFSDVAAKTIFEYNGLLDKFIGDGVMSLFGVLNHKTDDGASDAVAAVQAAIKLRSRFDDLLKEWIPKWTLYTAQNIEIGLGCGLHTGEVLAGNMGTDFRDQFTALGPNVNLASRIESRTKCGEILLSQSTAERVKNTILVTAAGQIDDIKNIPGTYALYSV